MFSPDAAGGSTTACIPADLVYPSRPAIPSPREGRKHHRVYARITLSSRFRVRSLMTIRSSLQTVVQTLRLVLMMAWVRRPGGLVIQAALLGIIDCLICPCKPMRWLLVSCSSVACCVTGGHAEEWGHSGFRVAQPLE